MRLLVLWWINTVENRHLQPEYFSMEMVLRVNLGPLHLLENFIDDIFSNSKTYYLRKETRISQMVSKDSNKSAAIATFQKNNEKKILISIFFLAFKTVQIIAQKSNCILFVYSIMSIFSILCNKLVVNIRKFRNSFLTITE